MARYRIVQNQAGMYGTWLVPEGSDRVFPVSQDALDDAGLLSPDRDGQTLDLSCESGDLDEVLMTIRAPALDPLFAGTRSLP